MWKKVKQFAMSVWEGSFEYPQSLTDYYEESAFWDKMKDILCSPYSKLANIMYLFYGDLECVCCAFYRGLLVGGLAVLLVGVLL